jgi:hypothetical protein
MSDALSGITIESESSYGEKVVEAVKGLPVVGGAVGIFAGAASAVSDGGLSGSDLQGLASEGASFISSCSSVVSDVATDPIGWLVGEGLDFLISICQPLQDAIHMVSGDGPALSTASGNFSSIAQGIANFADEFAEECQTALADWDGEAAEAAAAKFGEFTKGIRAVAGEAGNISELLQISSMIMTVIEEFIKALLTELITWLIMIWVPALAAAIPTAGASTAAAGAATGVRAAQTGARATKQVNWLRKLLDKIQELLAKLRDFVTRQGRSFREAMDTTRRQVTQATQRVDDALENGMRAGMRDRLLHAETGMVGSRVSQGFGKSMRGTATDFFKDQVSMSSLEGHYEGITGAAEARDIGEDQPTETTSRQLDF